MKRNIYLSACLWMINVEANTTMLHMVGWQAQQFIYNMITRPSLPSASQSMFTLSRRNIFAGKFDWAAHDWISNLRYIISYIGLHVWPAPSHVIPRFVLRYWTKNVPICFVNSIDHRDRRIRVLFAYRCRTRFSHTAAHITHIRHTYKTVRQWGGRSKDINRA